MGPHKPANNKAPSSIAITVPASTNIDNKEASPEISAFKKEICKILTNNDLMKLLEIKFYSKVDAAKEDDEDARKELRNKQIEALDQVIALKTLLSPERKQSASLPKELLTAFELFSPDNNKLEEHILNILKNIFLKSSLLGRLEKEAELTDPQYVYRIHLTAVDSGTKQREYCIPDKDIAQLLANIFNENLYGIVTFFSRKDIKEALLKQLSGGAVLSEFNQLYLAVSETFSDLTKLSQLPNKLNNIIQEAGKKSIHITSPIPKDAKSKEASGWRYAQIQDNKSAPISYTELNQKIRGRNLQVDKELPSEKQATPPIDYQATHSPTQTSVSEKWGRRHTQEDRVDAGLLPKFDELDEKTIIQTLSKSIADLENTIEEQGIGINEGSTVSAVVMCKDKIYTTNLGDSHAFIALLDEKGNIAVTRLTEKFHEPNNPEERVRITTAGGTVVGRQIFFEQKDVGIHKLAVSRSIGDNLYNQDGKKIVSHEPDIFIYDSKKETTPFTKAFVINACDGLTEKIKDSREKWIKETLENLLRDKPTASTQEIADKLVSEAFQGVPKKDASGERFAGSEDNISVMVTPFNPTGTPSFTAIFDGHGGDAVSEQLSQHFHKTLEKNIQLALKKELPITPMAAAAAAASVSPAPKPTSTAETKEKGSASETPTKATSSIHPTPANKTFKRDRATPFAEKIKIISGKLNESKDTWEIGEIKNPDKNPSCEIHKKDDPDRKFVVTQESFTTEDCEIKKDKCKETFKAMLKSFFAINPPENPKSDQPKITTAEELIKIWKDAIKEVAEELKLSYTDAQINQFIKPHEKPTPPSPSPKLH